MVPGVSRSAASIIGGMQQKFTRHLAAEFSFFLAVPTMLAASCYTIFLKKWRSMVLIKRKGMRSSWKVMRTLLHSLPVILLRL